LQEEEQLPKRLKQSSRELSTHSMNFLSHASTQLLRLLFSFLSAMAVTSYIFVAHKRASLRVVFYPVAIALPNSRMIIIIARWSTVIES